MGYERKNSDADERNGEPSWRAFWILLVLAFSPVLILLAARITS